MRVWWLAVAMVAAAGLVLTLSAPPSSARDEEPVVAEVTRWLPAEGGAMKRVSVLVDTRLADAEAVAAALYPQAYVPSGVSAQFATFAKFAPEDIPVAVGYDNSGDPPGLDIAGSLSLAAGTWNAVPGQSFRFALDGPFGLDTPTCAHNEADGISTVVFSHELRFGVLGETCTFFSGSLDGVSRLAEFDLHFSADIPWSDGRETPGVTFDLPTVMLHELGHALGLEHAESGTVMQRFLHPGTQLRSPTADDLAGLLALYGTGGTPPPTPEPGPSPFRSALGSIARD